MPEKTDDPNVTRREAGGEPFLKTEGKLAKCPACETRGITWTCYALGEQLEVQSVSCLVCSMEARVLAERRPCATCQRLAHLVSINGVLWAICPVCASTEQVTGLGARGPGEETPVEVARRAKSVEVCNGCGSLASGCAKATHLCPTCQANEAVVSLRNEAREHPEHQVMWMLAQIVLHEVSGLHSTLGGLEYITERIEAALAAPRPAPAVPDRRPVDWFLRRHASVRVNLWQRIYDWCTVVRDGKRDPGPYHAAIDPALDDLIRWVAGPTPTPTPTVPPGSPDLSFSGRLWTAIDRYAAAVAAGARGSAARKVASDEIARIIAEVNR